MNEDVKEATRIQKPVAKQHWILRNDEINYIFMCDDESSRHFSQQPLVETLRRQVGQLKTTQNYQRNIAAFFKLNLRLVVVKCFFGGGVKTGSRRL